MTSFTFSQVKISISILSSRNMKPRSHFCCLTSIESPMKRDVIFDQKLPSYNSIDFNQTTTEKQTWYKSWVPFALKCDSMSKMAVIHNCFTVKLSDSPFIRHSTKLWTARAINNTEHRSEARVVAARKAFWVKGNERTTKKWLNGDRFSSNLSRFFFFALIKKNCYHEVSKHFARTCFLKAFKSLKYCF